MGSRKSSTKSRSDSTSRTDYVDWTKPAGQKALQGLDDLYNRDRDKSPDDKVYQGDRVIDDFNPDTNKAIDAIGQNADDSAHTTTDIHDLTERAVNPYFEENLQNNLKKMGARLSNSAAYGGLGTSDTGRVIGREMSTAMTGAMNDQWNATQNRRIEANKAEQAAYANRSNLLQGAADNFGRRDVLRQAQLDANREKWDEGQNADWNNLGRYIEGLNAIRSGTGQGEAHSSGKTTTSTGSSPLDIAQTVGGIGAGLFGGKGAFPALFGFGSKKNG